MNVLVLYQSRSGHTYEAAQAVADAAAAYAPTMNVSVKSVIEVQSRDVDNADLLFVGTWVQGFILFGVKPAGADLWVPSLPKLDGKPVGVFCTYAFNPRGSLDKLSAMLQERGAVVVGRHAFHRSRTSEGAQAFVQGVMQSTKQTVH